MYWSFNEFCCGTLLYLHTTCGVKCHGTLTAFVGVPQTAKHSTVIHRPQRLYGQLKQRLLTICCNSQHCSSTARLSLFLHVLRKMVVNKFLLSLKIGSTKFVHNHELSTTSQVVFSCSVCPRNLKVFSCSTCAQLKYSWFEKYFPRHCMFQNSPDEVGSNPTRKKDNNKMPNCLCLRLFRIFSGQSCQQSSMLQPDTPVHTTPHHFLKSWETCSKKQQLTFKPVLCVTDLASWWHQSCNQVRGFACKAPITLRSVFCGFHPQRQQSPATQPAAPWTWFSGGRSGAENLDSNPENFHKACHANVARIGSHCVMRKMMWKWNSVPFAASAQSCFCILCEHSH